MLGRKTGKKNPGFEPENLREFSGEFFPETGFKKGASLWNRFPRTARAMGMKIDRE